MKRKFLTIVAVMILLSACQTLQSSETPTKASISETRNTPTKETQRTTTPTPAISTNTATIQPTNTPGSPAETPTPAPVIDAEGNITWHPQQVLILSEEGGGMVLPLIILLSLFCSGMEHYYSLEETQAVRHIFPT